MTKMTQTTFLLPEDTIDWLNMQILNLKISGWQNASKSAIVRTVIKLMIARGVELKNIKNEDELFNLIAQKG